VVHTDATAYHYRTSARHLNVLRASRLSDRCAGCSISTHHLDVHGPSLQQSAVYTAVDDAPCPRTVTFTVHRCSRNDKVDYGHALAVKYTECSKNGARICFCNNFGKCKQILILFSLLQQENYGAQYLSYFSHLTFIMLPLYRAKQTLILVSMQIFLIMQQNKLVCIPMAEIFIYLFRAMLHDATITDENLTQWKN